MFLERNWQNAHSLASYPWFLAGVSVITLSLLSYSVLMAKAKGG
jgi:hypothetical protein